MKVANLKSVLLGAALVAGSIALTPAAMAGGNDRMYEVTIQNATLGQPLSPPVIATHTNAFQLFELGPVPSMADSDYDLYFALATVAETGYPFHLLDEVASANGVWDAVALPKDNGPMIPPVIFPGDSNSTIISAAGNAKYLSVASMLGMTNDGFWAVRGAKLPRGVGDMTRVFANGYDAGSEANAETDTTVGGADGDNGATGAGINTNGEGYIHVHYGVQGIGDLSPAQDWRNPVVEVTIERIE
ncbi:MAG: spondin domain-containing protein [Xanthomonadales bacterium]|nr:spondin domain-containing protein [Xanthomonadales bacterium]